MKQEFRNERRLIILILFFKESELALMSGLNNTDGITFVLLGKTHTECGSCIRMVSSQEMVKVWRQTM